MANYRKNSWDDVINTLYRNGFRARRIHQYIHQYIKEYFQINEEVISVGTIGNRCRELRRMLPDTPITDQRVRISPQQTTVDPDTKKLARKLKEYLDDRQRMNERDI